MSEKLNAPLDEVQYSQPDVLVYWQGVHADSVHCYFSESPFFDHTSKNGVLWGQALHDGYTLALYSDRQQLEKTLRSRPGTEYMIVGEPQAVSDPSQGPDTGVWVLRKQDRIKRPPREDELTTLGTYYVTGENVYQAPSVYDVVGNHLLSAMTSLSVFMDRASTLPLYSPANGYAWLPPTMSSVTDDAIPEVESQDPVTEEDGMMIDPQPLAGETRQVNDKPSSSSNTAQQSSRLMEIALSQVLLHGDEYMDQNPLIGEPGNLHYTYTKEHFQALKSQAEAAAKQAEERQTKDEVEAAERDKARKIASAAKAAASQVPAAFSTRPGGGGGLAGADGIAGKRKGSKADLKRRRKSKAVFGASVSASAAASPVSGLTPDAS